MVLYLFMRRQGAQMKWNGRAGEVHVPPLFHFQFPELRNIMWNSHIFTLFTQIYTILYISMRRQGGRMKWNGEGENVHAPPLFHFQLPELRNIMWNSNIFTLFIQIWTILYISMCRQRERMKWNGGGGEVHAPSSFHFQLPELKNIYVKFIHIYVFYANWYNF
jgi:hypothetical protein